MIAMLSRLQNISDFHKVECFLPFVFETAKRTDIERSWASIEFFKRGMIGLRAVFE